VRTEGSDFDPQKHGGVFATTHWSVVLAAGREESPQAVQALEKLCRTYWYPLYVFARRRGYSPEDAQDLTQQFFLLFLEKHSFGRASPERGKFRTFLLHSLQNFLANEWKRARCLKRGGGATFLSLDVDRAESRYSTEPTTTLTPEREYDKRWAITLLERVLSELEQEYVGAGKGCLFAELSSLLWGKDATVSYAQIGQRLSLSDGAVRGAMHRLRAAYREKLRMAVAHTVADFREVDSELRYLITALNDGN
jgi:RNA polymerase sigma-70 factor (ECF subfamily)